MSTILSSVSWVKEVEDKKVTAKVSVIKNLNDTYTVVCSTTENVEVNATIPDKLTANQIAVGHGAKLNALGYTIVTT